MKNNKTIDSQWFNSKKIFNYVQKFSFPRLCGTDGEKKAVNLTVNTFKEIGFDENEVIKEPIEFSDFYSTTLIKFIALMSINALFIFILSIWAWNLLFVFNARKIINLLGIKISIISIHAPIKSKK